MQSHTTGKRVYLTWSGWRAGLLLCLLLALFSRCKAPNGTCGPLCQQKMFLCFQQFRGCDEVCALASDQSVACQTPPVEQGAEIPTVTLLAKDCGACHSALLVWQRDQDCQPGQVRCAKKSTRTGLNGHVLQKCVDIQGRWTWSEGRLCDSQDPFPCVFVDNLMQCLGCGVDQDCASGERCNPTTKRCVQCVGASDCPGSHPYCSATGRCVACTLDSHCQPTFSGHYCVRGSCACEQNSDCWAAGYPTCVTNTRQCQPCHSDKDCPSSVFGRSSCLEGRCLMPCQSDEDCSALNNGICVDKRCSPGCRSDEDCKALKLKFCSNRRCYQCLKHLDCPVTKPFCHPKLLSCTQCLSSEDCPPSSPVCDQSLFSCSKE